MHIKPGVYRHFKDVLVRVICVGKHSETLEDLVVYEKLQDFHGAKKGSMWIRPLTMFTEKVEHNGKTVPRFEYVGDK